MTRNRYKIFETYYPYLITCTVVNWLPLLKTEFTKQIIIESLKYLQKEKRLKIFAYTIMHNHLHLIITSENPAKQVAAFKSFTARKIIDYYKKANDYQTLKKLEINVTARSAVTRFAIENRRYRFWQSGYCPKQIMSFDIFQQKIDYIHLNPVRKGYVESLQEWKWSSASPAELIVINQIVD